MTIDRRMFLVDGLSGHTERIADLLPGPTGATGGCNLAGFESFDEPSQHGDGAKPDCRVGVLGGGDGDIGVEHDVILG